MGRGGGTRMHCPKCRRTTTCAAIPLRQLGESSEQRWFYTDHRDIHWFRRGRECLTCFHEFTTSEVNEKFLRELVELREALSEIKRNAEKFSSEAGQAASTLEDLSHSLNVLKALKIYQDEA